MKITIGPFPGLKSKKDRVIKIKIDKFDSWNADQTIALIAVPILKQLQKTKHGAPGIDDEDVPVKLRSTSAKPLTQKEKENGSIDKNWFKRFDWTLAEMVWALNEIAEGYPGENKFHKGRIQWTFEKQPDGTSISKKGPKDTYKLDRKGYDAYHARIANGCRLFGKYFQSLWD